jgi:hypothetical protein
MPDKQHEVSKKSLEDAKAAHIREVLALVKDKADLKNNPEVVEAVVKEICRRCDNDADELLVREFDELLGN